MKKLFILCAICFLPLTMNAQKCAVLEFRGAKSLSEADVDGISEMFMTYFHPAGYTMVERVQIDKVIYEQGFQRTNLTERQSVRIGEILNASKVVLGTVSMLGGEYQVDVRVVDVESGHDVATEGASFNGNYRTNISNLATKLANKIAIKPVATAQPQTTNQQDMQYVDLGLPSGTLWKVTNESGGLMTHTQAKNIYGKRLPSMEQWEELNGMCTWVWIGKAYKVTGPNGKSITLPAAGYRNPKGTFDSVGEECIYWSYESNSERANYFEASSVYGTKKMGSLPLNYAHSVRLVKLR